MSSDLTPKQESFVQKYIELNGNATEAYRHAYDTESMNENSIRVEGWRLLQNPAITQRIEKWLEEHRNRHRVTVDSITGELEEARGLAMTINQPSAAVSASMGKAKLNGLIVEKNEHSGPNGQPIESETNHIVTPDLVKSIVQAVRDEF